MSQKLGFRLDKNKLPEGNRFLSVINFYEKNGLYNKVPGIIFNGLFIPFDPGHKNVGAMLSAGIDSTILTYIVCHIIEELKYDIKVHPISVVRNWKNAKWSVDAKKKVYGYLKDRFPNIIQEHRWGFLPTAFETTPIHRINLSPKERSNYLNFYGKAAADVYYFISFQEYIYEILNLDTIYEATTTNPIDTKIPHSPTFRNADKLIRSNDFRSIISDVSAHPFRLIEKSWPIAQYDNFNILDLKSMTRSCNDKDVADEGCGRIECFPCNERKWANENKHLFLKDFHLK
jgi:hypothetical protein